MFSRSITVMFRGEWVTREVPCHPDTDIEDLERGLLKVLEKEGVSRTVDSNGLNKLTDEELVGYMEMMMENE